MEAGWTEFSGHQAPGGHPYPPMSVAPGVYGSVSTYPPMPPAPNVYGSGGVYPPVPGAYPNVPGMLPPPLAPAPKRKGMSLGVMLLLGLLAALLIFGGVFVSVHIAQGKNSTAQTQTTGTPDQLYKRVTSQTPTFTDTLQDTTTSSWETFDQPTFGCTIQADGLHVHIQDLHHFAYCVSNLGSFSNVALQVEMKILSGDGGGLILRSNSAGANIYYFHIYPNGEYRVYKGQSHQLSAPLSNGSANSFVADQKNTITAIAQGSQLYFYVNQKFLTMVQDATYSSGAIGVSSASSTTSADVVYTNAKIWRL